MDELKTLGKLALELASYTKLVTGDKLDRVRDDLLLAFMRWPGKLNLRSGFFSFAR